MLGCVFGDSSLHHGVIDYKETIKFPQAMSMRGDVGCWYLSRKEIEENSPSRHDGIDFKKETYLRKSYCAFLRDLGMRLKVPQLTIATSTVFCHRFFLRQSHAKNDRRTIATVCMFLAGKAEESPRTLKDIVQVSYCLIHKNEPDAAQRIKHKDVYEQQKEVILLGERVVLATIAFDLIVHHPYKPLVEGIRKFKVAQNEFARYAWNFVNDGLMTSLCLQFKPCQIAAGAFFLAAKALKIKLPSDGGKTWWQDFDVTPLQLEEISNQMLELYDQSRIPQGSELEGSSSPIEAATANGEFISCTGPAPGALPESSSSSGKAVALKYSDFRSGAVHTVHCDTGLKEDSNNDRSSMIGGGIQTLDVEISIA